MHHEQQAEASEHPYEPPVVESVLTVNDLEREIQYAGTFS
jgi:hypothetical protein